MTNAKVDYFDNSDNGKEETVQTSENRVQQYSEEIDKIEAEFERDELLFKNESLKIDKMFKESSMEAAKVYLQPESKEKTKTGGIVISLMKKMEKVGIPTSGLVTKLYSNKTEKLLDKIGEEKKEIHAQIYSTRGKGGIKVYIEKGERLVTHMANKAVNCSNMVKAIDETLTQYQNEIDGLKEEGLKDSSINIGKEVAYLEGQISKAQRDREKTIYAGSDAQEKFQQYLNEIEMKKTKLTNLLNDYHNFTKTERALKKKSSDVGSLLERNAEGKTISRRYKMLDEALETAGVLDEVEEILGPNEVAIQRTIKTKQESIETFTEDLPYKKELAKMNNESAMENQLSVDEQIQKYATIKAI